MSPHRSPIAVIALVAVAALGGSLVARATGAGASPSPASGSVTLTINPVRILDTRGGDTGGPTGVTSVAPLGPGETLTVQVSGATGQGGRTVPSDLTGAVLNVTAVGATRATFLTLYPCDEARPGTSTSNPVPGEVTVNAATVDLSAAGTVCVYNNAGQVDLVVDVTAVQVGHDHDDRYYTKSQTYAKSEIDAALRPSTVRIAPGEFSRFHPSSGSTWDLATQSWVGPAFGDCIIAPVHLPTGSRIVEARGFFLNTSASVSDPGFGIGAATWGLPHTTSVLVTETYLTPGSGERTLTIAGTTNTVPANGTVTIQVCFGDSDHFYGIELDVTGGTGLVPVS